MRTKIAALLFVACLISTATKSQENFFIEESCIIQQSYTFDIGNKLLFLGTTNTSPNTRSLNQDFDHVFALSTDHEGKIIDKKIFNEYKCSSLEQVLMTSDSNFVILVRRNDKGLYCTSSSMVLKIDAKLNVLWSEVSNTIPDKILLTSKGDIQLIGYQCALNYQQDKSLKIKTVVFSGKDGSVEHHKVIFTKSHLLTEMRIIKITNKSDTYARIYRSEAETQISCDLSKIVTGSTYYHPEHQFYYMLNYINSDGHKLKDDVCFNLDGEFDKIIYDTLTNSYICFGTKEILDVDSSHYLYQIIVPANMINYNKFFAMIDTNGKLIYQKTFNNCVDFDFYDHQLFPDSNMKFNADIVFYDQQLLSDGILIVTYRDCNTDMLTLKYFTYKNDSLLLKFKKNLNFIPAVNIKNIVLSKSKKEIFIIYQQELERPKKWMRELMLARIKLSEP